MYNISLSTPYKWWQFFMHWTSFKIGAQLEIARFIMQKLIYLIDIFASDLSFGADFHVSISWFHYIDTSQLSLFRFSHSFSSSFFLLFHLYRFQNFALIIHWRTTLMLNDKVFIRAKSSNEITKTKLTQQAARRDESEWEKRARSKNI